MSEKRYCFIPEGHKDVNVYNAGMILDVTSLKSIIPAITFKYCNDPYEKAKIFYVEGQSDEHATDEEEYFRYKTVQAIKSLFKVTDIYDYKLVTDEHARLEFTLFYDADGNFIATKDIVEKNKRNTILAHRYTYIFYKRYN